VMMADDDDWYAPDRTERQLEDVQRTGLTGLNSFTCLDESTGHYWRYTSETPWFLIGASFCMTKEFRFQNSADCEDLELCRRYQDRVYAAPDSSWFLQRVHSGNHEGRSFTNRCWTPVDATLVLVR